MFTNFKRNLFVNTSQEAYFMISKEKHVMYNFKRDPMYISFKNRPVPILLKRNLYIYMAKETYEARVQI